MIRQKTIIKRMILKTALSLLFVAICCYLLCAASTLTQTSFGSARHWLKGELWYHFQNLWTFEPQVVLAISVQQPKPTNSTASLPVQYSLRIRPGTVLNDPTLSLQELLLVYGSLHWKNFKLTCKQRLFSWCSLFFSRRRTPGKEPLLAAKLWT